MPLSNHFDILSSSFSNDLGRLAGDSRREYDLRSSSGRPILLHPLPEVDQEGFQQIEKSASTL